MPPHIDQSRWFAEKVQPHEPELRAFLRRQFPRLTDVDDLVQETYVRLIRAQAVGEIAEPRAYMFTTARHAACDVFRKRRPISTEDLGRNELLNVVEEKPDAAETASHAQELALLTEAIRALPPRCRDVVTLRRLHGLPYRDIAARLGISEKTVNAHLALGLIRCQQFLAARGVVGVRNSDHCETDA